MMSRRRAALLMAVALTPITEGISPLIPSLLAHRHVSERCFGIGGRGRAARVFDIRGPAYSVVARGKADADVALNPLQKLQKSIAAAFPPITQVAKFVDAVLAGFG